MEKNVQFSSVTSELRLTASSWLQTFGGSTAGDPYKLNKEIEL